MTTDFDATECRKFLEIWFAACPAKQYCEVRPLSPSPDREPWPQGWYTDVDPALECIRLAVDHGDNVYIGALPRKRRRGLKKDVGAHVWIFADVDFGTVGHISPNGYAGQDEATAGIRSCDLEPTMIVHTGNGLHAWWRLSEPADPLEWQTAEWRLVHKIGGDDNATDPGRILRVPGTPNRKTNPAKRVVLL